MRMENICKSFKDVEVLKDFSLNVDEGEHIAIWESRGRERPLF